MAGPGRLGSARHCVDRQFVARSGKAGMAMRVAARYGSVGHGRRVYAGRVEDRRVFAWQAGLGTVGTGTASWGLAPQGKVWRGNFK